MWILFLVLASPTGQIAMTSAEFGSEFACRQAIANLRRDFVYDDAKQGAKFYAQYSCVEKYNIPSVK